jgi:hypothetical protein
MKKNTKNTKNTKKKASSIPRIFADELPTATVGEAIARLAYMAFEGPVPMPVFRGGKIVLKGKKF